MELNGLLKQTVENNASDLHLAVHQKPLIRVNGSLKDLGEDTIDDDTMRTMLLSFLSEEQKEQFLQNKELDCGYHIEQARFRVSLYFQRGSMGGAFRAIPSEVPSLDDIDFSGFQGFLDMLNQGLVIVTGATGQGKSTTLAACVNYMNETRQSHIMTLEDPIEFLHHHKKCLMNQREIGHDSKSFPAALKHVLRQDPDIILVGEMRDLETISATITLAETGHIVFTTLHTIDAAQTVDRMIDVFPSYQQQQIRMQLSNALKAIVAQQLIPRADNQGRVAAREEMFITTAIQNLIREGKSHQIYSAIQTGGQAGMVSMDNSLKALYNDKKITHEEAVSRASSPMAIPA